MSDDPVVGKDILSYCGKCKLALSATIVSLKGASEIAKVQCNTCKSTHAFRDPARAKMKSLQPKKATIRKKDMKPIGELWKMAVKDFKGEPEKYTIRKEYEIGALINHPKFGIGRVQEVVDGDKIEVLFESDMKTLVHKK